MKIKKNFDFKNYKNRFYEETCIIVGTGPSLNKTDLNKIKNFKIFGVNNGYLINELKYDFFCVSDYYVWNYHKNKIKKKLDNYTNLFVTNDCFDDCALNRLIKIKKLNYINEKSNIDIQKGVFLGDTVIIVCLQIAYYMGFKYIGLIGCDCNYDSSGIHHFDGSSVANYVREDWNPVFEYYKTCKKIMKNSFIFNSTVGGKLEVFPRISLSSLEFLENTNKNTLI